jgi:hypothetical protein
MTTLPVFQLYRGVNKSYNLFSQLQDPLEVCPNKKNSSNKTIYVERVYIYILVYKQISLRNLNSYLLYKLLLNLIIK